LNNSYAFSGTIPIVFRSGQVPFIDVSNARNVIGSFKNLNGTRLTLTIDLANLDVVCTYVGDSTPQTFFQWLEEVGITLLNKDKFVYKTTENSK